MNGKPWPGNERRKSTDHDTLVELVQIIKNHVENFESHRGSYGEHVKEDNRRFDMINKSIWMGTGIVSCVVFVLGIIFRH